jgi:hypothetical protein
MTQLEIVQITGVTLPYDIYICDVYGNQCVLVATINTPIPPGITLTLPPQFDMAPAIGFKIIDIYCEKFVILYCNDLLSNNKQFQDSDSFFFMNYNIYQFQ